MSVKCSTINCTANAGIRVINKLRIHARHSSCLAVLAIKPISLEMTWLRVTQTTQHMLQTCPLLEAVRKRVLPNQVPLTRPATLRQSGGPTTNNHLHCRQWGVHLTRCRPARGESGKHKWTIIVRARMSVTWSNFSCFAAWKKKVPPCEGRELGNLASYHTKSIPRAHKRNIIIQPITV